MALPFGRQTSREALEETTRSIKSSLTEGSSRIFGSVMGAKRGLMGGLSSTFDQVVNIVGGGEGDAEAAGMGGGPGGESVPSGPTDEGASRPKPRPPKPPAPPVSRQRSELDANGALKTLDNGGGVSRPEAEGRDKAGPPSSSSGAGSEFADGKQRRRIDAKPPLKRRNTNPFMDDFDPTAVEPDYPPGTPPPSAQAPCPTPPPPTPATGDGVKVAPAQRYSEPSKAWNNSGSNSREGLGPLLHGINAPADGEAALTAPARDLFAITPTSGAALPAPEILPERRREAAAAESDADSEGTEGCDDELDEEDHLADAEGGDAILRSGSRNFNNQSWGCSSLGGGGGGGGEEGELDEVSAECTEFMKYFVQKIFDPSQEITAQDKAKFGELCQDGFGRLWFARCINSQRVNNKRVTEVTFYGLVQFFVIVLFECNEADDYGPAKTLMNMCFTFHCEGVAQGSNSRPMKQFLYSFLKDQPIWQSPRFWNAAFFYAVQQERASKPLVTSNEKKEEKQDDRSFQENITFGQLGTFTSNMRAFGLTKEQCLEFIRKQATIANLPPGQIKQLRQSMERWTEDSFQ